MGNSKSRGVLGTAPADAIAPAATPGPLGTNDRADPTLVAEPGDTPGTLGLNDAAGAAALPTLPVASGVAGGALTPLQFEARYHNLTVSYLDAASGCAMRATVNVHRYANDRISRRRSNMEEKNRLVRLVRAELRRAGGLPLIDVEDSHRVQIAHVFYAKGSPEEFAVTFRHAIRYGRTAPGTLQHYCDETAQVGLDCSGFVNNYFLASGRITQEQSIAAYARGTQRRQTADIQPLDVLIWDGADSGASEHIAVVDSKEAGSDQMVVVESSGSKEGLVHSTYTVLAVTDGVFRVDRGGDAQGRQSRSNVRIYGVA